VCKSFYTVLFSAVLLVVALSFASTVAAQESTSEETTMMAADADDPQVDAETDNVSVEVDNGKVSAKTSDVSTSNETSSQQSSLTVQQNQADEGSGSRASTGDVNTDRTSNNFTIVVNERDGVQVASDSARGDTTEDIFVNRPAGNYELKVTVRPERGTTFSVTVDDCNKGGSNTTCENPSARGSITQSDSDGMLDFTTNRNKFRVSYTVNFKDSNNNRNNRNNRNNNRNRNNNNRNNRIIRINRDNDDNLGAARRQYGDTEVIVKTIPDKGRLADTGGLPLAGVAVVALASVGLGLSILRFATRRDP
jgi:hypothetical protein